MARVALNALYDSEAYPVDISEMLGLTGANLALTRSFLTFCAIDPKEFQSWPARLCESMIALLPEDVSEAVDARG